MFTCFLSIFFAKIVCQTAHAFVPLSLSFPTLTDFAGFLATLTTFTLITKPAPVTVDQLAPNCWRQKFEISKNDLLRLKTGDIDES